MNTVDGSFKSDLKVSLPIYLTNMAMHRNAKMRLAIGENIPKTKQNSTQVTINVSHKEVDFLTFQSGLFIKK